jgi:hypothetical protein
MQKLIVALSAVLITGLAGFSITGGDAQEARILRPAQAKKIESEEVEREAARLSELELVQLADEDTDYYIQRTQETPRTPQFRTLNMRQGEAGTWQIVTLDKLALLLNTATGETFSLEKGEEGLHWRPIARPDQKMPALPRMPNFRELPDQPDLEEKLERLRKELRDTKGEARERIEKAIDELEQSRKRPGEGDKREKKDAEPRKYAERDEEAKRDAQDTEAALKDIEAKISDMKERYEDSDSVKERQKLEQAIKELKEKAEALRKERKTTR